MIWGMADGDPVLLGYAGPAEESRRGRWIELVVGVGAGLLVPPPALFLAMFLAPRGRDLPAPAFAAHAFHPSVGFVLLPLILWAMIALACAVARPAWFARRAWVWWGLKLGLVLSALLGAIALMAFSTLFGFTELGELVIVFMLITMWIAGSIMALMMTEIRTARSGEAAGILTAAIWVLAGAVIAVVPTVLRLSSLPLATLIVTVGVCWPGMAHGYMLWRLRLLRERKPAGAMLPWVWSLGAGGLTAATIALAIRRHAMLPETTPALCFVVSAAARGHRRLVGSMPVHAGVVLNRQLRTLICAELALAYVAPRLHRALRQGYNRVGPALARQIRHPLAGDVAYLCLKPLEWLAALGLRTLVAPVDQLWPASDAVGHNDQAAAASSSTCSR